MIDLRTDFREYFKGDDVFDQILHLQGRVFREHKNRKTLRIVKDGRGYFVKIHRKTGLKEIFKNIMNLRLPVLGARNELNAIKRMEELGIDTMKVAGFGERGIAPAWQDSFLITEELENTVSLEDLARRWKTDPPELRLKRAIIAKVADIARVLHQNGVNHRDFYLCHFLLELTGDPRSRTSQKGGGTEKDRVKIYLIDLHRVQIRDRTPSRWIVKDLAGLYFSGMDAGLTRRDLFRFMKAYRGKPLRTLLRDEKELWGRVSRRAFRLYKKHFHRVPGFSGKYKG
ncbi:MAG: lipopolysaccharide core heptose(I) kinase RfaP [Nitrospirota bacterium]